MTAKEIRTLLSSAVSLQISVNRLLSQIEINTCEDDTELFDFVQEWADSKKFISDEFVDASEAYAEEIVLGPIKLRKLDLDKPGLKLKREEGEIDG